MSRPLSWIRCRWRTEVYIMSYECILISYVDTSATIALDLGFALFWHFGEGKSRGHRTE